MPPHSHEPNLPPPLPSQARVPETRRETDSMGAIDVPRERLWGAQTQRSLHHFAISDERLPECFLRVLAILKKAAALTNAELGTLEATTADAIAQAADEVVNGQHPEEFPLVVWQTGSGTQTNMNMNEVLANRASELLGGERGLHRAVHPNDHVNRSQSTNDIFSSALNIVCAQLVQGEVLPELNALRDALAEKADEYAKLVKIGRTHLQDATPLTLGQEISAWVAQLDHGAQHLSSSLPHLYELAIGGTAVGTGLNAPPEYAERAVQKVAKMLGLPLVVAKNRFEALAAHDAVVFSHGALKTLAASLSKIANDIRWLGSGPRAGLGELLLPANEPGSSIMPGKVNPTQCEAMLMVCAQVLGNDVTINIAGSSGNFQLNVHKPLLVHCFVQSARLLADSMRAFRLHLIAGLAPNRERITQNLERSLMLVTALTPKIGYEKAAEIAHRAHQSGLSLREAALQSGHLDAKDFDEWVRPEKMV